MKKKWAAKAAALTMAAAMTILAGCGGSGEAPADNQAENSGQENADNGAQGEDAAVSGQTSDGETVKISLYPADANLTSGVVSGHKAEYFAENGIELEVWAYSDEKTNAILASGDLPDIMYVSKDNLDTMIEAGMLMQLDDYLDRMPHLQAYEPMEQALNYVREYRSAGTGNVYCLPLSVGQTSVSYFDATERNSVKLRWDVYEEIGTPAMENFDDVIDVMEQMVAARPEDADGNPFYGTVLNTGSDTDKFQCMALWYKWQGYDEIQLPYLLEANFVDGTCTDILNRDSMYYKGLKWYNEVYRRGLMDPDSINNDRATQKVKVDGGFAMIPGGYLPGWAPNYQNYYIPGTKIYYSGNSSYGDANKVIAINANTENLDACLKLLDMWCDPDAVFRLINGRDGDFWESDGENAHFTDFYYNILKENNGSTQNTTFPDGEDATLWNTSFCVNSGEATTWKDGNGGYRKIRFSDWDEVNELIGQNENFTNWKKTTGQESWLDWLESENAYFADSELKDVQNFCSQPDDSMQLTLDTIKDTVVNASWKMVYAASDEEFEQLWDSMVSDCEGLGAKDVQEWRLADIENAKKIKESLKAD